MRLFYVFIILSPFIGFAQPYETNPDFNRTRNWHFGDGTGLHFTPDTVYVVSSNIQTVEAAAVHTDQDGNLLLYSNGEKIWNANHEVIHNGSLSLGHNSSSMGSVFVIHEDNPDYIYLFNTNFSGSTNKQLSFNLIVREADTFRVVFKDSVLQTGMSEPIAVVKADNGKDIWIVTHVFNGSSFITYRLTQEGLIPCPVTSNSQSYAGGGFQGAQFDMVFSTDGKYLLKSNQSPIVGRKDVSIFTLNHNTGEFDRLFAFEELRYPIMGIAFSKDNKNIFIVERDSFLNVYSFNPLDSLSTVSSKKKFFVDEQKFEMRHLTYKNDIALSIYDLPHLALIINSNDFDLVDLTVQGISLGTGIGFNGLPNFNQSYFYNPPINFTDKTRFPQQRMIGSLPNKE